MVNATSDCEGRELGESNEAAEQAAASTTAYGSALIERKKSDSEDDMFALGLQALIDHPEQMDVLRAHPLLLDSAVEEILRYSSPTLYNRRTAVCDVELGGQKIRSGDKVTLWWASANFDESVFADAMSFNVARNPNPHLAFGYRSHFCLGANLALAFLRKMPNARLAFTTAARATGTMHFSGTTLEKPL